VTAMTATKADGGGHQQPPMTAAIAEADARHRVARIFYALGQRPRGRNRPRTHVSYRVGHHSAGLGDGQAGPVAAPTAGHFGKSR
jgi:hypothetical protein